MYSVYSYYSNILQMFSHEPQMLVFTIPIFEPLPNQYYVKAISDRWIGCESMCAISFQHLILPERHPPHTGKMCSLSYVQCVPYHNELISTRYYVKAISDRWIGCESMCAISFQHLTLPERHPPHTGKMCYLSYVQCVPYYNEPLPSQQYVKAISDIWILCESMYTI